MGLKLSELSAALIWLAEEFELADKRLIVIRATIAISCLDEEFGTIQDKAR